MRRLKTLDIERHLADIAQEQFGLVTTRQAAVEGIDCDRLNERARRKTLVRVHPGVYRFAAVPISPDQVLLAAWLAVSRSTVAIAGVSAAQIHGLPVGKLPEGINQTPVDLVCSSDDRIQLKGIRMRRTGTKPQTQGWNGARITNASQTLCDLARSLDRDPLARCVDHAIAHRIATVASIREIAMVQPKARFKVRALLLSVLDDRRDGRLKHRSKLEGRIAKWLVSAGLGDFVPNFVITEAGHIETDFAWIYSYVCLEISPFFTHGSEEKQQQDSDRRLLLAPTRWTLIEATDADLQSREAFERIIRLLRDLIAVGRVSEARQLAQLSPVRVSGR